MNDYLEFKKWIAKAENAELLQKQEIDELADKWQKAGGRFSVFMHCLKDKVPTEQEFMEALNWLTEKRNEAQLDTDQFDELFRQWIDEKGTNLNALKAVLADAGIAF